MMPTTSDEMRLYRPRKFTRTTKQRFFRDRKVGLVRHVGGAPSRAQLTLMARIVQCEWDLLKLDAVMDAGELSPHAMRTRLAMENRLRLDLRELGMKSVAERAPSLREYLAESEPGAGEHGDTDSAAAEIVPQSEPVAPGVA